MRVAGRGVLTLAGAQALALLAAMAAATLYPRWLTPQAFGEWALALTLARAGLLLLDGGLKTALVRRADLPALAVLSRLTRLSAGAAIGLTAAVAAAAVLLSALGRMTPDAAWLLAAIPAAYWLSYPWMFPALARLERAGRFGLIGQAEGAAVVVEFVLPAALLAVGLPSALAFLLAAGLARGLRCAWLRGAARRLTDAAATAAPSAPAPLQGEDRRLLGEGSGIQAVAGLSMLRDQMPLWLLLPWFGAAWAGHYSLALTACALASQVAVQTAARVALPTLRQAPPKVRWPLVLAQTRVLAIATLPPLALLPAVVAWADATAWDGRWQAALALLPWLALRMVPGVATTTLGAWLLVARTPWAAARVHAGWTGTEVLLALAALAWLGPIGLALAGALGAWAGLAMLLRATTPRGQRQRRGRELATVLLARPAALLALALAACVQQNGARLGVAAAVLPLCWLAEPAVRAGLARRWRALGAPRALPAEPARPEGAG